MSRLITGTYANGVFLSNPSDNPVTVFGSIGSPVGGIALYGTPGTSWYIENLLRITGSGTASTGILLGGSGTVANLPGALISGGLGVHIDNAGTVKNFGTISGTSNIGAGVEIASGTVGNYVGGLITGGLYGVYVYGAGAVSTSLGTIAATGTAGIGVDLYKAGGSVSEVSGLITGAVDGVKITGSAGTVTASGGTISATGSGGYGVNLRAGGSVSNTGGLITGTHYGVAISGATGIASNSGTISSSATAAGSGVRLKAGGTVINTGGRITGGSQSASDSGVYISGALGTVSNSANGTISSSAVDGNGVYLLAGGSVGNTGGLITSDGFTVYVKGAAGTVTNSGTAAIISSTRASGLGVIFKAGGTVSNTDGRITAPNTGVEIDGATGMVTNAGTGTISATGTAGIGVFLSDGGSVGNTGGLITGNQAVDISGAAGTVSNSGTGTIAGTGTAGDGVILFNGGSVGNTNGLITGISSGVLVQGTIGAVTNSGTGTISGTGTAGIGVFLFNGGSVGNSGGLITGTREGVFILGTLGAVTNSGTGTISATGTGGLGVYLAAGGSVSNTGGNITGRVGIKIAGAGATVINSGFISGSYIGVNLSTAPNSTIVDSGTISSSSGTAINLGSANTVVIQPGAVITGAIANVQPGDQIDVTGATFSNSESVKLIASNVLRVNDNGTLYDVKLDPNQSLSGDSFQLSADTGGGTLISVSATVPLAFSLGNLAPSAGGWTNQDAYPRVLGDVNGDGLSDIVGFASNGAYISFATGGGKFSNPVFASASFGANNGWASDNTYPRELADVNGDGKADIVGFASNGAYVSLSNGDGTFGDTVQASASFGINNGWMSQDEYPRELADVNGDGKADIVAFASNGAYVALSNGDGSFAAPILATSSFGTNNGWTSQDVYPRELADVNGDHKADIVAFGAEGAYVALSNGDGTFAEPVLATPSFGTDNGWLSQDIYPRELADVNGDGKADIVAFASNGVYTALGNGDGTFQSLAFDFNNLGDSADAGGWTSQNTFPRLTADVTGDGSADIVAFGANGVYVADGSVIFPGHTKI